MSEAQVTPTTAPAESTPNTNASAAVNTAAPQEWTTGLNDDLKGYVQNKGFKDPGTVLESYRNLEKLMGAPKERLMKLPEKEDDAQAWGEIYNRLGRPAKADEYKIDVPQGLGDENFAKWAQSSFHELGLTKKQGEALAQKWNEYVGQTANAQTENYSKQIEVEEAALKKEWGMAFDQNVKMAKAAAREFGLDAETITKLESAMGFVGAVKFMHAIGSKVGEDSFVSGSNKSGGFGALTPEAALNRINALKSDQAWVARYISGDASAKSEIQRLHEFAYPNQ